MIKEIANFLYDEGFNVYYGKMPTDEKTSFFIKLSPTVNLIKYEEGVNFNIQIYGESFNYEELQEENERLVDFLNKNKYIKINGIGDFTFYSIQPIPFDLGVVNSSRFATSLNLKVLIIKD